MLINQNGVETLYYGYADNQGSLIALTDASGNVVEKYAYDPWGARRNPNDWTQLPSPQGEGSGVRYLTNRGYTGHEHLDLFNIINMNGRVYDPLTAQFYSPDPFIQSGNDWKNYNRYSYCMNNPTRYTDPSGYKFTGERTSNDSQRELWSNYAGSYGGGGSSSFRAWAASHRGSVSYNWENYRYEYANGDDASSNSALDQLYSRTSPQDILSYSGSSLGYDHLYTLNIGGQLRLAGSLGGEITGTKNGQFTVSNNGYAANLAANSELIVTGIYTMTDPDSYTGKDGCVNLYTQNQTDKALTAMAFYAGGELLGAAAGAIRVGEAISSVSSKALSKAVQFIGNGGIKALAQSANWQYYKGMTYFGSTSGLAVFGSFVGGGIEGAIKYFTSSPPDVETPYLFDNPAWRTGSDFTNNGTTLFFNE
jgi:RHS repeat-associated protein